MKSVDSDVSCDVNGYAMKNNLHELHMGRLSGIYFTYRLREYTPRAGG